MATETNWPTIKSLVSAIALTAALVALGLYHDRSALEIGGAAVAANVALLCAWAMRDMPKGWSRAASFGLVTSVCWVSLMLQRERWTAVDAVIAGAIFATLMAALQRWQYRKSV
jgi:hypothetical protein